MRNGANIEQKNTAGTTQVRRPRRASFRCASRTSARFGGKPCQRCARLSVLAHPVTWAVN